MNFDIPFPVEIDGITYFEEINAGVVSVNVFGVESSNHSVPYITPLRTTEVKGAKWHIDLLLLEDGGKKHYIYIKELSRLLNEQGNKHKEKKHYCKHCLWGFGSGPLLEKHCEIGCLAVSGSTLELPQPGQNDKHSFHNIDKQFEAPCIFADFECFTSPCDTSHPNPKKSFTNTYQVHQANSFSYLVVSTFEGYKVDLVKYRGENAVMKMFKK